MTDQAPKVTQADKTLRAAIWNNLGHDQRVGQALTRYGMTKFNDLVDHLLARHRSTGDDTGALREALEKERDNFNRLGRDANALFRERLGERKSPTWFAVNALQHAVSFCELYSGSAALAATPSPDASNTARSYADDMEHFERQAIERADASNADEAAERCAKIADNLAEGEWRDGTSEGPLGAYRHACREIAAAIRATRRSPVADEVVVSPD